MTLVKTKKFLRLLSETDIPTITLMPLLSDTLKSLIPAYEISIIEVNIRTEPTTYYSEKFDEKSHDLFSEFGSELALNKLSHDTTNLYDPAAYHVLFSKPIPYGNLVPVTEEYLNGATYRFFFEPNGIYHALDILIKDKDKPVAVIGIFRQKNEPAFTAKEVYYIKEIYSLLCAIFLRKESAKPLPTSRWLLEKSTMMTVDAQGNITSKAPEAIRLLMSALGCKARELLNKDQVLPERCLAFRKKIKDAVSNSQNNATERHETFLSAPYGRLHLRAYQLEREKGSERYGIHIDYYGDMAEAMLAYLRQTCLSAKLVEIAYLSAMENDFSALCTQLNITNSSLKTYLNRLYTHFNVSDFERFKAALIDAARQHAESQTERRHLLKQFLRD